MSKNTKKSIAFFDGYTVFRNVGPQSFFNFYVQRTKYKIEKHGRFNFLQKGDTVLIEYSIEDPSVGKVIDFCYMKKHKGKDYCNCLDE